MTSQLPILALDVDGVLIDGIRWDTNLEQDLGINPGRLQREFFNRAWHQVIRGKIAIQEPLVNFLAAYPSPLSAEQLLSYWHDNDANLQRNVLNAALSWQQRTGGRLALATNQDITRANYLRDVLGLGEHFTTIIASCFVGAVKSEVDYFRAADKLLARKEGQQIFFLDDEISHVDTANDHGWQAHHVKSIGDAVKILSSL